MARGEGKGGHREKSDSNCWNVDYTWCDGQMQGKATEKMDRCKGCVVYKNFKVDEAGTVTQ